MDDLIQFDAVEERKVIPLQDIFDVSTAALMPMRETITTTEYALDDLPGLMDAHIDAGKIDLRGLEDGGRGVVYVTTTTTTQLIEAPSSEDEDENVQRKVTVTKRVGSNTTTTTTTSTGDGTTVVRRSGAAIDDGEAALAEFALAEEKSKFYKDREKERQRLIRNQAYKVKPVTHWTPVNSDDHEQPSSASTLATDVVVTSVATPPTTLHVLLPATTNGHRNKIDADAADDVNNDYQEQGSNQEAQQRDPGEVDSQSILDNKHKVKEFLTNRMLENPPSPISSKSPSTPGTPTSTSVNLNFSQSVKTSTMILTNGAHDVGGAATSNAGEETDPMPLVEARPCFIESPPRQSAGAVQSTVIRTQQTTTSTVVSGTESWIAQEIAECRLREEELKRTRIENNKNVNGNSITYGQTGEPTSMTDSLMSQDSQNSGSILSGSEDRDDISLPTPPQSSQLSSPSPSPTPAGFVFPASDVGPGGLNARTTPSPASMLSNDEWLYSNEPRLIGKVRPIVDNDSDEENGPTYQVLNETAVERDVRLSREREDELRKEKERAALRLFSESTQSGLALVTGTGQPPNQLPPPPPISMEDAGFQSNIPSNPHLLDIAFELTTPLVTIPNQNGVHEKIDNRSNAADIEVSPSSNHIQMLKPQLLQDMTESLPDDPVAKALELERQLLQQLAELKALQAATLIADTTGNRTIGSTVTTAKLAEEDSFSNVDDQDESPVHREIRQAQEREEELRRDRSVVARQISVAELSQLVSISPTHSEDVIVTATSGASHEEMTSHHLMSHEIAMSQQKMSSLQSMTSQQSVTTHEITTKKEFERSTSVGSSDDDQINKYPVLKESAVERDIRLSREREEALKREKELIAMKMAGKLGSDSNSMNATSMTTKTATATVTKFSHVIEAHVATPATAVINDDVGTIELVTQSNVMMASPDTVDPPLVPTAMKVKPAAVFLRANSQELDREIVAVTRQRLSPLVPQSAPAQGAVAGQFAYPVGGSATLNRMPMQPRQGQVTTNSTRGPFSSPKGAMEKFIASKGRVPAFQAFSSPKVPVAQSTVLVSAPPPMATPSSVATSPPLPPPEAIVATATDDPPTIQPPVTQVGKLNTIEKQSAFKRNTSVVENKIQVELREMERREEELRKQREMILAAKSKAEAPVPDKSLLTNGASSNGLHNGENGAENGNQYANGSAETLLAFTEARKRFK